MVPTIENYSIDESFLSLGEFSEREVESLARELRERVHRWVGIPTCVGNVPTKMLAKVAGYLNGGDWSLFQEVLEMESGKRNEVWRTPSLAGKIR